MAKSVMQFRYYGESNTKNYPQGINIQTLSTGTIFTNYPMITQLGIQTLPGTEFYLNNSINPIIIGSTGIYELNLEGLSEITDLRFGKNSVESINRNSNAYLIIDVVYGE